jgi:membrane associated rhomboid family serine protease
MAEMQSQKLFLLKNWAKTVINGICNFKKLFLLFFLVFLISAITLLLTQFLPTLTLVLADSRTTPWGIVTAIFIHSSFEHFTSNIVFLFIFTFCFAFVNSTFNQEINRTTEKFFIASTLISAIASNVIWLILSPDPSVGASGLVYATEGSLFGFTLFNGLEVRNFSKLKLQPFAVVYMVFVNCLIFCVLMFHLFTSPASFLSVGEGVNVYAHGLSFYFAFFAVFVWNWVYARKHSILVDGQNPQKTSFFIN